MMSDRKILNQQNELILSFVTSINQMAEKHGISHLDAVVEYCERNDVDIEAVGTMIKKNPVLKARIEEDAENMNYLQKHARLPI